LKREKCPVSVRLGSVPSSSKHFSSAADPPYSYSLAIATFQQLIATAAEKVKAITAIEQ
jgi:hypothetical protein